MSNIDKTVLDAIAGLVQAAAGGWEASDTGGGLMFTNKDGFVFEIIPLGGGGIEIRSEDSLVIEKFENYGSASIVIGIEERK